MAYPLDADNLRKFAHECRNLLRDDIIEAMEAGAMEIDRLHAVVQQCQKRLREMPAGFAER